MTDFIQHINSEKIERLASKMRKRASFCISGLTSFLRLMLLDFLAKKKKIFFITASEQKALRYQNDLKKLFNRSSKIFPYQDVSMYE